MNDFQAIETRVRGTIENLYSIFANYRLRPHVEGCPCCTSKNQQKKIHSKTLRELEPENLQDFAFKAMTTWGDVDDFKHFLPRLFEIQTFSPTWAMDSEVLFGKLDYGHWLTWPEAEQAAVESYLQAYWPFCLAKKSDLGDVGTWLCSIAQPVSDLTPYLKYWLENLDEEATWYLAGFIYYNHQEIVTKSKLGNAFWDSCGERVKQIIDWLRNPETAKAFREAIAKNGLIHNETPELQSAIMFFSNNSATCEKGSR